MISAHINEIVKQLKLGSIEISQTALLERLWPSEFISDLEASYPIVFQERQIGTKHEIGMARKISLETAARQVPGSKLLRFSIDYSIKQCILVSEYDNTLSEITLLSKIRVRPRRDSSLSVSVRMRHGYKLDKTPDGWVVKKLKSRSVTLSESFLEARGWRLEVLGVFSRKQ